MRKFTRLFLILAIFLFGISSIGIMCGAAVLYRYSGSKVSEELLSAARSYDETRFYYFEYEDRLYQTGEAKEIIGASLNSGVEYEYVSYAEIPKELISAFVSIEDKRFFEHRGIDYKRSLGAILNYIVGGKKSFGGSTITQQLVKNLTGNDEVMIKRKISEAFSAIDLEKSYEKSEILEMYLNIINLSHGCRGIGAAARYYFSKNVKDLDLCESACLAAITNNPAKYDPVLHPDANKKRRDIILSCMHDQGHISQKEYQEALNSEIKLSISGRSRRKYNSWYVDAVIKDVVSDFAVKYSISTQNASVLLYKGGYKIYTAMDCEIQSIIEEYFENTNNFPKDENGEAPQSSMIVIDPYSGDVLGIAGGVGEKIGDRIQNRATDTKRPPGSSIKPLSVYAPAIENGFIKWSSIIEDSPVRVNEHTGVGWPSNANNKYLGRVNIRYSIANSLNTVAVKVLDMIGNEKSFDFLTECLLINSLDKNKDMGDASLALGQPSVGITLRELTGAYSIFENGIMNETKTYYKVTDKNGVVILDNSTKGREVISLQTAAIMTKLLEEVVQDGTASGYITLADKMAVAGKTGTSQFSHDKYFIGYTPDLLAGIWQGYDMPRSITCYRGNYSICIWDDIMNRIYENTDYMKNSRFKIPSQVEQLSYDPNTGESPMGFEDIDEIELGWFDIRQGASP